MEDLALMANDLSDEQLRLRGSLGDLHGAKSPKKTRQKSKPPEAKVHIIVSEEVLIDSKVHGSDDLKLHATSISNLVARPGRPLNAMATCTSVGVLQVMSWIKILGVKNVLQVLAQAYWTSLYS